MKGFQKLLTLSALCLLALGLASGDRLEAGTNHAHFRLTGPKSPPPEQVMRYLSEANDPGLPDVVALLNGRPITRHVVSQAEVLANGGYLPKDPTDGLRKRALDSVIRDILLGDEAERRGLLPSQGDALQSLRSEGLSTPTQKRLRAYRRQRGIDKLLQQVVGTEGSPADQSRRVQQYVRDLEKSADIQVFLRPTIGS